MTDSLITDLTPALRPIAGQFVEQANERIAPSWVRITTTWRSSQDQNQACSSHLSNAHAGQSPHNICLDDGTPDSYAFDWSIFNADGSYVTDGTDIRYAVCGQIVKALGLSWGGDWTHPDFDHAEMNGWRSKLAAPNPPNLHPQLPEPEPT